MLYSIVCTAKANGLEPYGYLRELFETIPAITPEDTDNPHELDAGAAFVWSLYAGGAHPDEVVAELGQLGAPEPDALAWSLGLQMLHTGLLRTAQ